jgi:hypothetical protein
VTAATHPRFNEDTTETAPEMGGGLSFATVDERDAASVRLERSGIIVAQLEGVGPSLRGRLAEAIDETIERELTERGAPGPSPAGRMDLDTTLKDQMFRARRAGADGLAVVLGPLRGVTDRFGALDPHDCAALRFLASATRQHPLTVILDSRDMQTAAFGDPVPLSQLLSIPPTTSASSVASPSSVASASSTSTSTSSSTSTSTRTPESTWRTWTLQLAAARGPQPLAALERLFVEAYVPLADAIAEGVDDPRARRARDDFRDTFAAGYVEAFPTFGATTKRPRMVLDAHDIAARIARLHGARTVRLLLVDAMRWDLSHAVQERVIARLVNRASLTDELLLWSALPTTTLRQLETLARGMEALRNPSSIERDAQPPPGRNSDHVRRMRVGPRELYKLDVVESRVQGAFGNVRRELPAIAEAAAEAVVRHVETLGPRTLLFAFGDHGFTIDKAGAAQQGGASPEEVLVGAFALLVGDVH